MGTRITWQQGRPSTALKPPQKLIQLDADASMIGKNYPAEVAIVADAKPALKMLAEEVRGLKANKGRWSSSELEQCRENHRRWLQEKGPPAIPNCQDPKRRIG